MTAFTFIDLFCGCGGFSLGMERAGFTNLAAIDSNKEAMAVFRKNFPHVPLVLEEDLTKFRPADLDALLQDGKVDVIVGGPPCQGFSKDSGGRSGPGRLPEGRPQPIGAGD